MRGCIVHKPDSADLASDVLEFLNDMGFEAEILEDWRRVGSYDFIISVGGDGTILRLLQYIKGRCPPIFGINTGRVGLLTHCGRDYREHLRRALSNFETERFMRVECTVGGERMIALNEIAVVTSKPAKMIDVRVVVDGCEVEKGRCDGVLVSTPIGSTAYALSTGGPIVDPYMECILLVPVAPFKLGWKPWVISPLRAVKIEVKGEALVVADGHRYVSLEGGEVVIRKSESYAVFFKIEKRIEKTVEKLSLIR